MHTRFTVLALALTLGAGANALAQSAGSWSASVGVTDLSPSVSSGNLSAPSLPNTQASVNSNTQLTGAVNYMLTNHLAVSVPLGYGFKHNISGAGAVGGVGTIATTKALPITALLQYRFLDAQSHCRPYIGAGLSYAKFYDTNGTGVLTGLTNPGSATPTTMSLQSKWAPTLQLGVVFNLNDKWYVDANYTKTWLSTTATLSTGQTMNMTLNPNTYTLGLGYKF